MEDTKLPPEYTHQGLLVGVWRRMREIEATLRIKKVWTPLIQREGNIALIETFVTATGVI